MRKTVTVTSDDFYSAIDGDTPTLVDFWAEWCGPCKTVAPTLEEIAAERDGALVVAKLNVDDHPAIAQAFGVMSIPTLILFEDGRETKRLVGARSKQAIDAELTEAAACRSGRRPVSTKHRYMWRSGRRPVSTKHRYMSIYAHASHSPLLRSRETMIRRLLPRRVQGQAKPSSPFSEQGDRLGEADASLLAGWFKVLADPDQAAPTPVAHSRQRRDVLPPRTT